MPKRRLGAFSMAPSAEPANSKKFRSIESYFNSKNPRKSMTCIDHVDIPKERTVQSAVLLSRENASAEPDDSKNDRAQTSASVRKEVHLSITEEVGDIFGAPDNSILIHACNCVGSWSAGIALEFKKRYPKAFQIYRSHCKDSEGGKAATATALLIPPVDAKQKHFIGCLFTSSAYGARKDKPETILQNTKPAMEQLLKQVSHESKLREVGELRMCQINSGLFNVPWNQTKDILERFTLEDNMPSSITVFSLT